MIKAVDSKALDLWLKENSFASLSKAEKLVVDDYIQKDWCFSTTKLVRKESGKSTPHPLSFAFPSEKIIYPMALTALAGGEPFFGFFVISDQMVDHSQLDVYLTKKYHFSSNSEEYGVNNFHSNEGKSKWGLDSFLVDKLFWNGMVVTRLGANINSKEMVDLEFEKKSFKPIKSKVYSAKSGSTYSRYTALLVFNFFLSVLIVVAMILKRTTPQKVNRVILRSLLYGAILCLAVYVITLKSLTVIKLKGKSFDQTHPLTLNMQAKVFDMTFFQYNYGTDKYLDYCDSADNYIAGFKDFYEEFNKEEYGEGYIYHYPYNASFASAKKDNNQIVVKYVGDGIYNYRSLPAK